MSDEITKIQNLSPALKQNRTGFTPDFVQKNQKFTPDLKQNCYLCKNFKGCLKEI